MARKLPVLQRVVGEDALFVAIYGTISSSLYFALGVVALYALGLTPIVLPVVGLLVALAAGAYAEATNATGGGSPLIVRRAFGDVAGFLVGWAILLDLLVVALLSALFVPRYAESAIGHTGHMSGRTAEIIGVGVIALLGAARLVPRLCGHGSRAPARDRRHALAADTRGARPCRARAHRHAHALARPRRRADVDLARVRAPDRARGVHGRRDRGRAAAGVRESRPAAAPLTVGAIAATVLAYAVIAAAALSLLPVHPRAGHAVGLCQRPLDDLGHGTARRRGTGDRRAGLRRDAPATSCACS